MTSFFKGKKLMIKVTPENSDSMKYNLCKGVYTKQFDAFPYTLRLLKKDPTFYLGQKGIQWYSVQSSLDEDITLAFFCLLKNNQEGENPAVYLKSLEVTQKYQGKKVGQAVLDYLKEEFKTIELMCEPGKVPFYIKSGFEIFKSSNSFTTLRYGSPTLYVQYYQGREKSKVNQFDNLTSKLEKLKEKRDSISKEMSLLEGKRAELLEGFYRCSNLRCQKLISLRRELWDLKTIDVYKCGLADLDEWHTEREQFWVTACRFCGEINYRSLSVFN